MDIPQLNFCLLALILAESAAHIEIAANTPAIEIFGVEW